MPNRKSKNSSQGLVVRRVLFTVSDKEGIVPLAKAFSEAGAELVATGRTAAVLRENGFSIVPIEQISGTPEAFQGRMKTLSSPICSGLLYRRGDAQDEEDLKKLNIQPIDCVVVNFYPFEKAAARSELSRSELIEEVDIGGPTLVRAAAKNSPDVLVLTSPTQYANVIHDLKKNGQVSESIVEACAAQAWDRVLVYDEAIARTLGTRERKILRYGENPHQKGVLEFDSDGPIAWGEPLSSPELSYNNILDLSAAYSLMGDLIRLAPDSTSVVVVKHGNPCGVATVPRSIPLAQKIALLKAWEGDPVSAFGGVVVFSDSIEPETAEWLGQHFVELVAVPKWNSEDPQLISLLSKRKNLKAVSIRRFGECPQECSVNVPGGRLFQTADLELKEVLSSVTRESWPIEKNLLGQFGIAICRSLKSNAIALVREISAPASGFQLVGAGQGQPNRVDALKGLAIPRAQAVLRASEGALKDCVMLSDAFFPFRDAVDAAHAAGVRYIIQPGGSIRDAESIAACDEHGIAMAFTGVRHFRH